MEQICSNKAEGARSLHVVGARWYRIYVNNLKDPEFPWAIDEGKPETRILCFKVIWNTDRPCSTETFLNTDPNSDVPAWIAVCGVMRKITDGHGRCVITIMRK